jgi:RHS repeat-associated protein
VDCGSGSDSQTTSAQEPSNQFHTGKPYVADAGGYIYKYRTYNPEMSRWTSADPSGFPDGVNNFNYASNPVSYGDPLGLFLSGSGDPDLSYDEAFWEASKGAAVVAGWTITQEALTTAESGASSVAFSSSDTAEIQASTLYGEGQVGSSYAGQVYNDISAFEESNPGANFGPSTYQFSASDPDEYFGLHSLIFSTIGTLTWSAGPDSTWTYSATVSLTKTWSFSNYGSGGTAYSGDAAWNAVGYRLQYYGYIAPYSLSGSFTDTWTE